MLLYNNGRVLCTPLLNGHRDTSFGARVGPWCPDHGISFVFVVWLAKTCVNPLQPLEVGELSLLTACLLTLGSSVTVLESTQGLILVYFCMLRGPSAYLVLLLMLSSLAALLFQLISHFSHWMGPGEDLMSQLRSPTLRQTEQTHCSKWHVVCNGSVWFAMCFKAGFQV